ncbi:MAG: GerMN domain-containing protein [Synergistaceae bacterium]|jgi:hypothetical protein|nr:GerMN domain-containing protein [Synergistaceae bacterium]
MRHSDMRRKWKSNEDEPSPSEKRMMSEREEWDYDDEEDDGDDYDNVPRKKTPLLFRFLAWVSLIVIFFAAGYGLTSFAFKWWDSSGGSRTPRNLAATPEETATVIRGARSADVTEREDSSVTVLISVPEGERFVTRQIQCAGGLREDMVKQALSSYMDAVKEGKMLDPVASNLNIFLSGEWLYLNMNRSFLESLKTLGAEKSRVLLTGIVKTMTDNFKPISRIKFYVEGKEVLDKTPVDLTMPWGLRGRSS